MCESTHVRRNTHACMAGLGGGGGGAGGGGALGNPVERFVIYNYRYRPTYGSVFADVDTSPKIQATSRDSTGIRRTFLLVDRTGGANQEDRIPDIQAVME